MNDMEEGGKIPLDEFMRSLQKRPSEEEIQRRLLMSSDIIGKALVDTKVESMLLEQTGAPNLMILSQYLVRAAEENWSWSDMLARMHEDIKGTDNK